MLLVHAGRRHLTQICGVPCYCPTLNSRLGEVLCNIFSFSSLGCVLWLPNFLHLILWQKVKLHSHQLFPSQSLCVFPSSEGFIFHTPPTQDWATVAGTEFRFGSEQPQILQIWECILAQDDQCSRPRLLPLFMEKEA